LKIAVECQSLLLQRSVEIFLQKYLVPYKQCDILISDMYRKTDKPLFVLQDRLNIPFSKSNLHIEIDRFVRALEEKSKLAALIKTDPSIMSTPAQESSYDLSLEEQLLYVIDKFKDDLVKVLRKNHQH